MRKSEIISTYRDLKNPEDRDSNNLSLKEFVENYMVSLPTIVRAFPQGNLDIRALEGHYWDRLRKFYPYDDFRNVEIEDEKDIKFINEAIKTIEDWFYAGNWTECLRQPSPEVFKTALLAEKRRLLPRLRGNADVSNLGRDGVLMYDREGKREFRSPPLPDIFQQAKTVSNFSELYLQHAFKFFHGPAAAINTLTKVESQREIAGNDTHFRNFIMGVSNFVPRWRKTNAVSEKSTKALEGSTEVMQTDPRYIVKNPKNVFKRQLFFMKTAMGAGELIRRMNLPHGFLTAQAFDSLIDFRDVELEKARKQVPNTIYFSLNFAGKSRGYGGSSVLHINALELPMALIAVDFLNRRHLLEKKKGLVVKDGEKG
jgi:hypothetical protein